MKIKINFLGRSIRGAAGIEILGQGTGGTNSTDSTTWAGYSRRRVRASVESAGGGDSFTST